MPEVTSYPNGTPCWADLGAPDVAAAAAFYNGLLGWDVEIGPAEMGHYSMATVKGQPVAAIADQQTPGVVAWSTYFGVASVEDPVAKAVAAGATVLLPAMDVMTFGRMAILSAPGGAALSLWEPGEHRGAGLIGEHGAIAWNELATRDVAASAAFLEATFGLSANKIDMEGVGYYELRRADGTGVAGMMPMDGDMWPADMPDHWMVYFGATDTDATAARATELGGQVCVAPTDIPNVGRFAVLEDPQGATFSIITMSEA